MLTHKTRSELEAQYPELTDVYDSKEARSVYILYHFGRGYPEGYLERWPGQRPPQPGAGQHIWRDAEHFLDYLDTARSSSSAEARLSGIWGEAYSSAGEVPQLVSIESLANAARRILAAECCGFMQDFDPALERCEPYVTWAAGLSHADTVVSFNYDTLVERAAEAATRNGGRDIQVVTLDSAQELDKAKKGDVPLLLKLHGSVDWEHAPNKEPIFPLRVCVPFRVSDELEYALRAPLDAELSIAAPGPSKKLATSGVLAPLWQLAEQAIEKASEIIFIGYRFPPTNAQARSRLLGAISANTPEPDANGNIGLKCDRYTLKLTTVLGDDARGTERLRHLLEYALSKRVNVKGKSSLIPTGGRFAITPVPLFAEDYLTVSNL